MRNNYLVVVKKEFVRDAQIAMTIDADPMDGGDNWGDAEAELVIDNISAENKEQAIQFAAAINVLLVPEMLAAYQLADTELKG